MTLVWLIVWLIAGTPTVAPWNGWLVSLLVVAFLDLYSQRRAL